MKILLINSYYEPNFHGGADRSVQHLAEGLQDAGHEVTVVTLAADSVSRTETLNGVKVRYLAVNNSLSHVRGGKNPGVARAVWQVWTALNPMVATSIRSVLGEERPDIVHTHILAGFSVKPWAVAKVLELPIVHTLHDYFLLCPRGTMFRGNVLCAGQCRDCHIMVKLRRNRSERIAAVIGVSRHILEAHLSRGYFSAVPIKKTIFNAAGRSEPPFLPDATRGDPLRLGFLGRIEPFKGLELLLSSVSRICPARLTLKVAGTGAQRFRNHLRTQWRLPNVEYVGLVEPESFFREIDVLVVPSGYHDPAPRVILEAFAHGVPVLGANLGGIPELVEANRTGWIFDARDERALREKLLMLTEQPALWKGIREQCRRKAREFTRALMVERHVDTYECVLTRPG